MKQQAAQQREWVKQDWNLILPDYRRPILHHPKPRQEGYTGVDNVE